MATETSGEHADIEACIVGLYNVLFEEELTTDDIEFYELEEEYEEGEVYLPYIGLNVDLWQEWSTEKRVEVLVHEFAHTEDYEDDHHPSFWERVVDLTEIAIANEDDIEALFGSDLDSERLKRTVVDSVHEYVIETDVDTVEDRKAAVGDALGVSADTAASD